MLIKCVFRRSLHTTKKIFFGIIALILWSSLLTAQISRPDKPKPFGIIPEFTKNNTIHSVSEVASNVLRVINNTNKTVSFHLRFSIPQGWEILKQNQQNYSLEPGDSIFVPVRIITDKFVKGNTNYVVSCYLVSDKDVQFAAQNWYVAIQNKSSWAASIPLKKIYFVNNTDSSSFTIHFQNSGNADEVLHLSFSADRRIDVINPVNREIISSKFLLPLSVGTDTTLIFLVRKKIEYRTSVHKKYPGEKLSNSNEEYIVQTMVKSEGFQGSQSQSWTGTVSFFKIGNEIKVNEFKRTALPLTLEMNAYDVLSNTTTLSLDAYGNSILKNDQLLNYRFQTVFITNFLNEKTFLGDNHYIGYFSNRGSLEVGEIGGWGRSLINGKGIKGTVKAGSNQFGAAYAKSPGFFSDNRETSYGFYHHYDVKNFNISNYYSEISDRILHQDNTVYSSYSSLKINKNNQIGIGGGFSTERYTSLTNPVSTKGFGYELNYSAGFKKFYFTLGSQYGNSNYTLARGLSMYTGRATYYIDKQFNLSLSNQNFRQSGDYYFMGNLLPGRNASSDQYEVRFGFISPASAVYLKPSYLDENNYALHVITKGIELEYNARNLTNVRIATNYFMGYAKATDYDIPDFFISRFNATAKWTKLSLSLRYFYGPNQASEQLRFVQDKINPQTVNLTSAYDYWFAKESFLLSTNAGFSHETFFEKTNFRIKPELFYFTKSGFRFSIYATYINSIQGANPLLSEIQVENGGFQKVSNDEFDVGFGIKKQIGIPVPGKKYKSIKIVVFKDLNGNRIQDPNEEGVENILVNLKMIKSFEGDFDSLSNAHTHGDDFITNSKGEINYNNIPAGTYHIKMIPLEQMGEWFDGNEEEVIVNKKQTVYIALNKGVKLAGNIFIERDKYSNEGTSLDLSRIRVTAIDSAGKTYSSLTDKNGSFSMYLPMGMYTVSVNEAALGDQYLFMQSKMEVDLTKPIVDNYSITFNVSERKRKMEIKKFDSNGELKK